MERHLINTQPTHRVWNPQFNGYLDSLLGTIQYRGQAPADSTVQPAYNENVAGLADSRTFPGSELLPAAGGDPMHVSNWTAGNNATLSNPSPGVLRVTTGASASAFATQTITTIGTRYTFPIEARSDSNATPRKQDASTQLVVGTISTDWQSLDSEYVAGSTDPVLLTVSATPGEYTEWRLASIKTANPLNAGATGATPAQPFGGNIPLAWSYDGVDDYTDIYSAALDSVFDGDECTIIIFAQGDWGDIGTNNLSLITVRVDDSNNRIQIQGGGNPDKLLFQRTGGGVSDNFVTDVTGTNVYMIAMTVSKSGDLINYLVNGDVIGSDTGVGAWVGALSSARCFVGAFSTSSAFFDGLLTEVIIHPTRAMTPTEIADIYQRSGI